MQEQIAVMEQLNDFLERRGLRANFVAQQVGIGEASLYCFKSGHKLTITEAIRARPCAVLGCLPVMLSRPSGMRPFFSR